MNSPLFPDTRSWPTSVVCGTRLYTELTRLYPERFREAYGVELHQTFRDLCMERHRTSGVLGVVRAWTRLVPDLIRSLLAEHRDELDRHLLMNTWKEHLLTRILTAKRAFALSLVAGLCITAGALLLSPKHYMSTARVALSTEDGAPFDPYRLQTEFNAMASDDILKSVALELNLQKRWAEDPGKPLTLAEATQELRKRLEISQVPGTGLLSVKVRSNTGQEAAEIANRIVEVSLMRKMNERVEVQRKGEGLLATRYEEAGRRLRNLESGVESLREDAGVPGSVTSLAAFDDQLRKEHLQALESESMRARAEILQERARLEGLRGLSDTVLGQALITAMPGETLLPQLQANLQATEQSLAELTAQYSEKHPAVQQKLVLRGEIQRQIRERQAGILAGLEALINTWELKAKALQEACSEAEASIQTRLEKARSYFTARAELEAERQLVDALGARKVREQVGAMVPQRSALQMVDKAEPGLRPTGPNGPLVILVGVIASCLFGLLAGRLLKLARRFMLPRPV